MMHRFTKKISIIVGLALLLTLSACAIILVVQPSSATTGEIIKVQVTSEETFWLPSGGPQFGVLGILAPSDWSFVSGTYEASIDGNTETGEMLLSPMWSDSAEFCIPAASVFPGMQWIGLVSDSAYEYNDPFTGTAEVFLQVGSTTGDFPIGYMSTEAISDFCDFAFGIIDTSMGHWITIADDGIPCDSVDVFQARCISGGTLQTRVLFQNSTEYAGETVIFDVDGTDYPVTVGTNGTHSRAALSLGGQSAGVHTITLESPSGCFTPINVNCPADAGGTSRGSEHWIWDDESYWTTDGANQAQATGTPESNTLVRNYPNPFNPSTTIEYGLEEDTWVSIRIFDILGQEVVTLVNEHQTAGTRSIVWDGKNANGEVVAGGVYIYTLQAGNVMKSYKMMLSK